MPAGITIKRIEEGAYFLQDAEWIRNRVGVLIDRFGTDIIMAPHGEDHFRTSVTVAVSPQFFGWLAGIGKGIRISWPESVREQYRSYLRDIAENT